MVDLAVATSPTAVAAMPAAVAALEEISLIAADISSAPAATDATCSETFSAASDTLAASPDDLSAEPVISVDTLESRSEEHTSELQSLMRTSYAVFCLKQKKTYHRPATPSKRHNRVTPP